MSSRQAFFNPVFSMKILKFGGTSVGTPNRMKTLPELIQSQESSSKIVVLSALSGVTDKLEALCQFFQEGAAEKAKCQIDELQSRHLQFADALFQKEVFLQEARTRIKEQFEKLFQYAPENFSPSHQGVIMAQGEVLSTLLFHLYLQEIGFQNELLYAPDYIHLDREECPHPENISKKLLPDIQRASSTLFVIQGFICKMHNNKIGNLKRGGSDYTASLLGAALKAEEIQIWTDIDGLHNNDPRYVENTHPIRVLSYDEAAELAYFGAKILHPQSIHPARDKRVPVRLLNTMNPQSPGTLITQEAPLREVVAIAAKSGITAVKIQSSRMLMAYGFLKNVFEIFEHYRTPIDMITTSEVAVSLTIDNEYQLPKITRELEKFGQVEIDRNQSIICIVGNYTGESHGKAALVTEALKHLPIRMISYGGSVHNISLLIPEDHKIEALQALHDKLF